MLLQVADRQEQFFADNKRYATNLTQLGYVANGFMIDDQGAYVVDGDANRLYRSFVDERDGDHFYRERRAATSSGHSRHGLPDIDVDPPRTQGPDGSEHRLLVSRGDC